MNCPYCRSETAPGAIRCPHCTSWIHEERRPVREWERARTGRWLGGVARGLASRFGIPVAALRLSAAMVMARPSDGREGGATAPFTSHGAPATPQAPW